MYINPFKLRKFIPVNYLSVEIQGLTKSSLRSGRFSWLVKDRKVRDPQKRAESVLMTWRSFTRLRWLVDRALSQVNRQLLARLNRKFVFDMKVNRFRLVFWTQLTCCLLCYYFARKASVLSFWLVHARFSGFFSFMSSVVLHMNFLVTFESSLYMLRGL